MKCFLSLSRGSLRFLLKREENVLKSSSCSRCTFFLTCNRNQYCRWLEHYGSWHPSSAWRAEKCANSHRSSFLLLAHFLWHIKLNDNIFQFKTLKWEGMLEICSYFCKKKIICPDWLVLIVFLQDKII